MLAMSNMANPLATMPGTVVTLQVDWTAPVPSAFPVQCALLAPTVSAAPLPGLLLSADARTASVQLLVALGVPAGDKVDLVLGHATAATGSVK